MRVVSMWWLLVGLLSLHTCHSYKLLVVFPFPSKSHEILGSGIVRHLLEAGHDVTYITAFPKKDIPLNLRQVDVSLKKKPFSNVLNLKALMDKESNMQDQSLIFNMMVEISKNVVEHENVQKLMHDHNERFDAVIAEWMFNEIYSGFATVFDCPLVWFFPFEHFFVAQGLIDEVPNPAYTPSIQTSRVPPFTFAQRLESLWLHIKATIDKTFEHLPVESEIYHNSYASSVASRGGVLPPYDDRRLNVSLVLVNSHVSLGEPMRLPQNYINIGGFHIETSVKPLPNDLQKIMDNAENGVIYFSMGSNLQSKELPEEVKAGLLKVFGELNQTVLWKFEEVLPNLPKNVHILQWAPQPSILSHPNCRLFITHGGFLSTTETVHFGVPVIGIPVFADQFLNVDKVVRRGFAIRVDLSYTMYDDLRIAIKQSLNNPKYVEKVKEVSVIYHDRPVPPGKELVHWVEHVVRTRGAPHLRSPALHVPWYQKMYLDLAALILTAIFVLKNVLKHLCCSKQKKDIQKKRN